MKRNSEVRLIAATMAAMSMLLGVDNAMGSAFVAENVSTVENTARCCVSEPYLWAGVGKLSEDEFNTYWKEAVDKGIDKINFIDTTIVEETAQAIAGQISNGTMTCFSFSNCNVTQGGMEDILKACCAPEAKTQLVSIYQGHVQNNSDPLISDKEVGWIADLLKKTTTLKCIWIYDTALTDDGVRCIAGALSSNNSLTRFVFLGNKNVTETGLKILRDAAKNRGLNDGAIGE